MSIEDVETLKVGAELVELEDGDVPEHGIAVLSFIDAETGDREYGWRVLGTPTVDQTVGLMSLAQHGILHASDEIGDS